MTPLASFLAKQIIARPKHRASDWRDSGKLAQLTTALSDIHCFEVSACVDLMLDMLEHVVADWEPGKTEGLYADFAFLPAPKTWVEWRDARTGLRLAFLFEQVGDWRATATMFCHKWAKPAGQISLTSPYQHSVDGKQIVPAWAHSTDNYAQDAMAFAHAFLPLLNSPHVVGRHSHMPNRSLERKLVQQMAGSFPLRAWTELKLEVNKPIEIDDGAPHEAHLTGSRAFHFVRKHLRFKCGRLEYVKAHWRGDIALGVKQTRYTAVPHSRFP